MGRLFYVIFTIVMHIRRESAAEKEEYTLTSYPAKLDCKKQIL